jgi:hypothetical protein
MNSRFWNSQAELRDARRSDRPTTTDTQALLQRADELTENDRWITTTELETQLSLSKRSVNNIIDALGCSKVCAR